ncbi:MAG: flagellar hook-length control protein FliK [Actinobacteria bacterium]|nr:flagellar hook-length control protein FliK [Actinomycetota bacterium]
MQPGGINVTGANAPIFVKALAGNADLSMSLKQGDIVRAKVLAFSQGSAVLNIGGMKIPISTQLAMRAGEALTLMVMELKPDRVVLRRLDTPGEQVAGVRYTKEELATHLLRQTGLKGGELARAVEIIVGEKVDTGRGIDDLLRNISRFEGEGKAGTDLERLLRSLRAATARPGSGETIEAGIKAFVRAIDSEAELLRYLDGDDGSLDNLKTHLLEARAALQLGVAAERAELFSGLRSSIQKMLDLINSTKALNLPVEAQAKEVIYIPLPVQIGDGLGTAEIRIDQRPAEGGGASAGSRFSIGFSLDMPSLGKTRALLETADSYVNFSIFIENIEALVGIDSHLQGLKTSLEALGYAVGRLSAARLPAEEAIKSLVEEKKSIKQAGIDVRA